MHASYHIPLFKYKEVNSNKIVLDMDICLPKRNFIAYFNYRHNSVKKVNVHFARFKNRYIFFFRKTGFISTIRGLLLMLNVIGTWKQT